MNLENDEGEQMKKYSLVFALSLLLGLCTAALAAETSELSVFAAASMTESMTKIAGLYKKARPEVEILYNFDSSGTLKTQIEQGAVCDIFISAAQKQMNELEDSFVMPGTRFDLLSNKIVLIVPKGANKSGISDFADAATDKVRLIALGNSDVPAGQYAEEIFRNLKIWDRLNEENKISFASNVKEVLAQTAAASVDCGVVYATDAATSDEVEIAAKAADDLYRPAVYPVAIMKNTNREAAAKEFIEFLKSAEAAAVFKENGFFTAE